jgi:hypothetical protein
VRQRAAAGDRLLASQKKAYGHWKAQVAVARELASRRRAQMRSAITRAESPR